MSAQGQTITWGLHVGKPIREARGRWLQHIGRWFAGRPKGHREALRMTLDRVWDGRRERLRPSQVASALEQATERGGRSWLTAVHSAAL